MARVSGGAAGTVLYMYDEAGHLIGEYTSTGALTQETIWLGDIPIATIRGSGASNLYYVHADHLGTPTRVTRPSDNKRRWQWNKDPFGTLAVNNNPEALGAFTYNLRFPGQIFDPQAGLHQNMFRDYSPAIGRYVESDPIGLGGGASTYGYVGQDPISYGDFLGLLRECFRRNMIRTYQAETFREETPWSRGREFLMLRPSGQPSSLGVDVIAPTRSVPRVGLGVGLQLRFEWWYAQIVQRRVIEGYRQRYQRAF
jgi:RHS repeat-associated protein